MIIDRIIDRGKLILQPLVKLLDQHLLYKFNTILFIIGIILIIISNINLVIKPITETTALLGEDDAYTYVTNGIQTKTCFFQDCPALEDLREQLLIPSPEENLAAERNRQYVRLFTYYQPLYNFLFAGTSSLGFSPETTFIILAITGVILFTVAISYWFYAAWGPGASGVALTILAFASPLNGHGTRASNMALSIALISWAILIQRKKHRYWSIPILVLVMCGFHNLGQIYAVVTLIIFFLTSNWPLDKKSLWSQGIILMIFISFFFFLPMISRPDFTRYSPGSFFTGEWNYRNVVFASLEIIQNNLMALGGTKLGLLVTGILVLLGIRYLDSKKKNLLIGIGVILGGLLFISVFYNDPWYPGVITRRVWAPLRYFIIGAISYSIWAWGIVTLKKIFFQGKKFPFANNPFSSFSDIHFIFLSALAILFFYLSYTSNPWMNGEEYEQIVDNYQYLMYTLDTKQPETVLSDIEEEDVVIYMDELPLYFYLSHGALQTKTIYYPAVASSPEKEIWLEGNTQIRYLVAKNPIHSAAPKNLGVIPITKKQQLIIESETLLDLSSMKLLLNNQEPGDVLLNITYLDEHSVEQQLRTTIPVGGADWVKITNKENLLSHQLKLSLEDNSSIIRLEGLHLSGGDPLNWPWNQGVTFTMLNGSASQGEPLTIKFDSASISEGLDLPLQIIADDGVTVLAEVSP